MNTQRDAPSTPELYRRVVSTAVIIDTAGRLILQQRDDVPGINYPGLIGLFGGHREPGETPLLCAQRELQEEIGQLLPLERFEPLVESRIQLSASERLENHVYLVRGIAFEDLVVTEGRPLLAALDDLPGLYARMTPATAFAVRQLIISGRILESPLPLKVHQAPQPSAPDAASQQQQ